VLYLGTHPETHEPTTIKVLSTKFLSNTDVVERFLKEANIIAMANHPNIVKLYGHGEWEGGLYIAMEFIQGISLRQYILQTPISLKRALEIIIDVAYALCHLHMHGVIHRDLKPENILVTESGAIKVIDFGIAQLLTEEISNDPAQTSRLIGTPVYMSPEQRENPESVSYPSDIYSLGIIAYELILGKLCHGQVHLSLMPKGIQKILAKVLQPNPKDRYQDVVDLIADLTTYLHSATWQEEKKVGDNLSQLSENLQKAQQLYFPDHPPEWENLTIGLASYKSSETQSLYHDFLKIPSGHFLILIGESSMKEAEGIVHTASTQGMIRALVNKESDSLQMIRQLNLLLAHPFRLGCLQIDPEKKKFNYLSCGYGSLWRINQKNSNIERVVSENPTLGKDLRAQFHSTDSFLKENDILILTSYSEDHFPLEENLAECVSLPPQQLVETLLRKFKVHLSKSGSNQSIDLICLERD
jgi:eukaryotic-like serine/threonine-protein kinase